jgi:glutamyl-tRNA synthetase
VGKSAAAINPGKLDWLNSQYIKRTDLDELVKMFRPFVETRGYSTADLIPLKKVVLSLRERVKTLVEMADLAEFYFCEGITYDQKAAEKFLNRDSLAVLEQVVDALSKEAALDEERCHHLIQRLAEAWGVPLVKIAQPLRVALTGKAVSPPIDEVMGILGQEVVVQRLQKAIEYIRASR